MGFEAGDHGVVAGPELVDDGEGEGEGALADAVRDAVGQRGDRDALREGRRGVALRAHVADALEEPQPRQALDEGAVDGVGPPGDGLGVLDAVGQDAALRGE